MLGETLKKAVEEQQNRSQKLLRLCKLQKDIEQAKQDLSLKQSICVELMAQLGIKEIQEPRHYTTKEQIVECRWRILEACNSVMSMNELIDLLVPQFEESTIKVQVRFLLEKVDLIKLGNRGPEVKYVTAR